MTKDYVEYIFSAPKMFWSDLAKLALASGKSEATILKFGFVVIKEYFTRRFRDPDLRLAIIDKNGKIVINYTFDEE